MISNHTKPTTLFFSSLSLKLSRIFLCEQLFACWTFSQGFTYIFWFITKVWKSFFKSSLPAFPAPKHTVPPRPFSTHAPSTSAAALAWLHLLLQGCRRKEVTWQQRHPQTMMETNPTSLSRLHIYLLTIQQQSSKGTQAVEQPESWRIFTKP